MSYINQIKGSYFRLNWVTVTAGFFDNFAASACSAASLAAFAYSSSFLFFSKGSYSFFSSSSSGSTYSSFYISEVWTLNNILSTLCRLPIFRNLCLTFEDPRCNPQLLWKQVKFLQPTLNWIYNDFVLCCAEPELKFLRYNVLDLEGLINFYLI